MIVGLGNIDKARLFYRNEIKEFDNQEFAYAVWLGEPQGVLVAFRGRGDTTPVYSWDLVDRG